MPQLVSAIMRMAACRAAWQHGCWLQTWCLQATQMKLKRVNDQLTGSELPTLAQHFGNDRKINLATYPSAQRRRIEEIVSRYPLLDGDTVVSFGVEPQRGINRHLDELLQGIRTHQTGVAGELTLALAKNIRAMNLPRLQREAAGHDGLMSKLGQLPLVGKWASALRYFQLSNREVIKHLAEIETRAQREMAKLSSANIKLDSLAEKTLAALQELEFHLAAGQAILLRARAQFERDKGAAAHSGDMLALTRLRDVAELLNAFEARLLRIHVAYTDAFVSVPQIRLTQQAARIEMHNIMDTLQFDIPRLKSAILRVAALQQIKQAAAANTARRNLTRRVGQLGADALEQAYLSAKQAQGNSVEDIALLAASADKLLDTLAKGAALSAENRRQYAQAQEQLAGIRSKFSDGLDVAAAKFTRHHT